MFKIRFRSIWIAVVLLGLAAFHSASTSPQFTVQSATATLAASPVDQDAGADKFTPIFYSLKNGRVEHQQVKRCQKIVGTTFFPALRVR